MNAFKHLLSTVGLVMGFACTAHAAPVAFGGSQYDVILAEGITWTAADAAASAMGSSWRLATITSAAEDSFVASLLSTAFAQRSHFWLGGTDTAVEGTWAWETGEAFSYVYWAPGEPNNSGDEDFLAYDLRSTTWAWNDAPDTVGSTYGFARGYIVERAVPRDVSEPGIWSLLALAAVLAGFASRRPVAA